jgi:hypothetical protein
MAGLSAFEAHYAGVDDNTQTTSTLLRFDLERKPRRRAQDVSDLKATISGLRTEGGSRAA